MKLKNTRKLLRNKRIISLFEISLLILATVAFSYLVAQTNDLTKQVIQKQKEPIIFTFLRNLFLKYNSEGLVSAQSNIALNTCLQNVNGSFCQEYPSSTCNSQCTSSCFPGTRANFASCTLGTCYDPLIGTCNSGVPQSSCTQSGGQWSLDKPAQCNRNCCLINPTGTGGANQAQFTTQQQCNYLGSTIGAPVSWVPVNNEIQCLIKVHGGEEGACVLEFRPDAQKYACEFTTKSNCLTRGGTFSTNHLCTDTALNTICTKTQNTKCITGKDEVYYVDSCGNRANIYDSLKLNDPVYWSTIVPRNETCLLGVNGATLTNQKTCGSCNYILGSICGPPQTGTDQNAIYGNYVCKDLSCKDENGNKRKQGESWCAFDSRIGLDGSPSTAQQNNLNVFAGIPLNHGQVMCVTGAVATFYNPPIYAGFNWTSYTQPVQTIGALNGKTLCSNDTSATSLLVSSTGTNEERAVDIPGSRHYKKLCFNGEVRTEPCAEYRDEICAQSTDSVAQFTTASCRVNTWQQCLAANDKLETLNKCEENPDCFLKHVGVDEFKFDICAPQFPPGLSLDKDIKQTNAEETICSYGSVVEKQACTYVEKKGFTGWHCIFNCACKTSQFTETMNNLCISLGDCGGHVNLAGEFSDKGYSISVTPPNRAKPPKLGTNYISGLQKYTTPVKGQSATVLNRTQIAAIFGVKEYELTPEGMHSMFALIGLGAAGLLNAAAIGHALGIGGEAAATTAATTGAGAAPAGTTVVTNPLTGISSSVAPTAPAPFQATFGTAVTGAAVGASIGYIIGSIFGLSGTGMTVAMVAGAAIGLAAGLGAFNSISPAIAAFFTSPVTILVLVVIMIVMLVLGIGKMRQTKVEFKCLPWQAPPGGAHCNDCGTHGLACSKYKCESYGAACKYLNEGTGNETCVNIAPTDAAPPIINVNPSAISSGFNYDNPRQNIGTGIKKISVNDGCLKEYSPVTLGLLLNEPGQCRVSDTHTSKYDEMTEYFGKNNLYLLNHTTTIAMPTLDDLGVTGIDPARRGNYDFYVRCEDASGNSNGAEYAVHICIAPADDHTPPAVTQFVPVSPGLAGLNATAFGVQFYTNEPADCRFSITDTAYDLMSGNILCSNGINQVTLNGWSCNTQLPLTTNSSTFYLRCADQPWLGSNDTDPTSLDPLRNVNTQSVTYQVLRTALPLRISSVTPQNKTISVGSAPTSVNLELHTADGISNGNALCEFSINGGGYAPFFSTGAVVHTQLFNSLLEGTFNFEFRCKDLAGNTATASTSFTIEIDARGPTITRVYDTGSYLSVVTNEASICAYSTATCSFSLPSGTQLAGNSLLHTMTFSKGVTYHLLCEDSYHNVGTCLTVSEGY